jgi:UDPglucose 6-dehydrogenase
LYDKRIGESHTSVPGPDGRRGFGGTCFPKDTSSLLSQILNKGMGSYIINAAKKRNLDVDRPEKDWEEKKGRAVVE